MPRLLFLNSAETGLYYLQQRYYDPETGRFINADSVVGNSGNSTYNLFAYCSNDPVNKVDPTGMCACSFGKTVVTICNDHLRYYGGANSFNKNKSYYDESGKFMGGKKPGVVPVHAPNSPFAHGHTGKTLDENCRKCYVFYSNADAAAYLGRLKDKYSGVSSLHGTLSAVVAGVGTYGTFKSIIQGVSALPGGPLLGSYVALAYGVVGVLEYTIAVDHEKALGRIETAIGEGKGVILQDDLFIGTWDTYPNYDAYDMLNWEPNP